MTGNDCCLEFYVAARYRKGIMRENMTTKGRQNVT